MRLKTLVAIVGTLVAVSYATAARLGPKPRERRAAEALAAIVEAQKTFYSAGGHGGYATSIESLTTPCPGSAAAAQSVPVPPAVGYAITVRAFDRARLSAVVSDGRTQGATSETVALDCHGRPTTADFVASAAPIRPGIDGLRALSVSSDGRIFAFFDGVPPSERDMAPGGLAMRLDNLPRIP